MATENQKLPLEAQHQAGGPFASAAHPASRGSSLAPGASADLALLSLASSASADMRYRRAESLLPCGLTQDELGELLGRLAAAPKSDGGRHEGGTAGVPIGGGVTVTAGGAGGTGQGSGEERAEDARASG